MAGAAAAAADSSAWAVRGFDVRVDRPLVLGVINLTPDSFSDGGSYADPGAALARAERMFEDGADLIDVGGESTRPGAGSVDATKEWSRIGPVVEALALRGIPVSIDTTKADVARRAVDRGAAVFDVEYDDLVGEVRDALAHSMQVACDRGCSPEQLVVDPGIGFGKSTEGNLELIAGIGRLLDLARPILVGPSRKSFIGAILDVPVEQRIEGTIAACLSALERGARLFRVHDVLPVRRALDVAWAIRKSGTPGQAT
jgi:dihydropteroate synthase